MERNAATMTPNQRRLLQRCPLPANAPFEIHGARERGCAPGADYLFQGFRYIPRGADDVLIREDVRDWLMQQQ